MKIWYSQARDDEGKAQLVNYLRAAGLEKGYLVVFDELAANPVLATVGDIFELTVDEKVLRVYLVGITV